MNDPRVAPYILPRITTRCASADAFRRRRKAFTIVEVLVALAIFTMMAVVLTASYLNVLHAYESIKTRPRRDLDVRFARNALLAESDFETVKKGAQFEGASGRQITWTAEIEPTFTANLFFVTFTCQLGAGKTEAEKEETVVEMFRLIRPTWAQTSGFSPDSATLRTQARDRILQEQQPSPLSGLGGSSSASGGSSGNSSGGSSATGGSGGSKNSGSKSGGSSGGGNTRGGGAQGGGNSSGGSSGGGGKR